MDWIGGPRGKYQPISKHWIISLSCLPILLHPFPDKRPKRTARCVVLLMNVWQEKLTHYKTTGRRRRTGAAWAACNQRLTTGLADPEASNKFWQTEWQHRTTTHGGIFTVQGMRWVGWSVDEGERERQSLNSSLNNTWGCALIYSLAISILTSI